MASQVYVPPKQAASNKNDQMMGTLLTAGGTIGGTMVGGPVGGAVGGASGSLLAQGMAKDPADAPPAAGPVGGGGGPSATDIAANAVARRQQALQDASQLTTAFQAVEQDPKLKQQFGPMLLNARDRAMYGA